MPDLAIDSGIAGAAVLGEGGRALCLCTWYPRGPDPASRVFDVVAVHADGHAEQRHGLPGAWAIGGTVAGFVRPYSYAGKVQIGVEDVYVGPNPHGAIELAKFAGSMVGVLELTFLCPANWYTAGAWRGSVFRRGWWASQATAAGCTHRKKLATKAVPYMSQREAAKLESLMVAPLAVPGLRELMVASGSREPDHQTDAGGILAHMWRSR